jgi:hypothetical protein
MTAFEKPAQDKTTHDPDAGNMELGKRIFELVASKSLAPKAALGTLKIIKMETPLGQKWLKFWRAAILLKANAQERIPTDGSPFLHPKRAKEARKLLNSLLPVRGSNSQAEEEQELVLHSMLLLGQHESWANDEDRRLRGIQLLAQVVALTAYHKSPLNEEAEEAYKEACDELPGWHFEGLGNTSSRAEDDAEEYVDEEVTKPEEAA